MLKEGGKGDRGARYAIAVASLKRKAEESHEQLEALRDAERSLLQAAKDDAQEALAKAEPRVQGRPEKLAREWGEALANAVSRQAQEAKDFEDDDEKPWAALQLAQETQTQVNEAWEAQGKAESEVQAQAVAEAEQALMMQAEAMQQSQAMAEAQAQAMLDAQQQSDAMAEMQLHLQAEAAQAKPPNHMANAGLPGMPGIRPMGLPLLGQAGVKPVGVADVDATTQLQLLQLQQALSGCLPGGDGMGLGAEVEVQKQLMALLGQQNQLEATAAALSNFKMAGL